MKRLFVKHIARIFSQSYYKVISFAITKILNFEGRGTLSLCRYGIRKLDMCKTLEMPGHKNRAGMDEKCSIGGWEALA